MKVNIRLIYLYLFSFVGLLVAVIGAVRLVDLALKVYVFEGADRYEYIAPRIEGQEIDRTEEKMVQERETERQRKRELSGSISMILVGVPLYLYHWRTIQRENKKTG